MKPQLSAAYALLTIVALLTVFAESRISPSIAEGSDSADQIALAPGPGSSIFLSDDITPTPEDTPTNTPTSTDTPVPPTATPTDTPVPPTPTPTDTPIPPTPTPTDTPSPTPTFTPTPTQTPTPTGTPTPTPTRTWIIALPQIFKSVGPRELLSNGSFESGTLSSWSAAGDLPVSITSDSVQSGQYAARLGNPNYSCYNGVPLGSANLQQKVFIPTGGSTTLSFSYRFLTQDTAVSNIDPKQPADTLDVFVVDASGVSKGVHSFGGKSRNLDCVSWEDYGWIRYSFDIGEFAGQSVTIKFTLSNRIDGFYNTYAYVDDVSVLWNPLW